MTVYDGARTKLEVMGIAELNEDLLKLCDNEAQLQAKNLCNITSVPDELFGELVNCVCGKYLNTLNSLGKLDDVLDFDTAVAQLSEGDMSISFVSGTSAKEQFLSVISAWSKLNSAVWLRFRRLVW